MMEELRVIETFWGVVGLAVLCAAWVGVQLLARQMGTKHHLNGQGGSCCGQCGVDGCTHPEERGGS